MSEVDHDALRMEQAIALARGAARMGNVPVAAIVEVDGEVVAQASNLREVLQDPTAHAELLALSAAAQRRGTWRLADATLYVTVEPCAMCAGAIQQARVKRVVFGATESKTGAVVSTHRLLDGTATKVEQLTHYAEPCARVMSEFFEQLRPKH
ncbi:MAG: nucleoside deaminase [Deltaproteobacteria bacterium]|nr:MAG: nucleoside deaminase [Deltaproteobacteria bacterium]